MYTHSFRANNTLYTPWAKSVSLKSTMRFHTVALLTGATAAAAGNTATLLLPGFQGRDLEAGIISKVRVLCAHRV